jgi:hypothetical protein
MVKFYIRSECDDYYFVIVSISLLLSVLATAFACIYAMIVDNNFTTLIALIQLVTLCIIALFESVIYHKRDYYDAINAKTLYKLAIKNRIKFVKSRGYSHTYEVKNTRGKIRFELDNEYISVKKGFPTHWNIARALPGIGNRKDYICFIGFGLSWNYHSRFILDHLEFLRGGPNESDN